MKKKKQLSLIEERRLYDKMWEWIDSKGNKITTSGSSNPTTNKTTLPSNIEPYFKKLIAYFQKYLTTDVICCDPRALSLEFPKTGNQLKLNILQMPTNNCVFCTIFDGSNNNEILGHSPQFQTWDQVLDWLIGQGLIRVADRKLCEWVDTKGNKVSLSNIQTASTPIGPSKIHDLKDKYDKLVTHLRSMYSLKVNRRTAQLLDVDIKVGTKFKNKLIVTYDYQKDCLVSALYDEFGKEVSSNNCWGGWSVLIAWLKKEGFPLIDHLCESKLNESCKFDFTKEDLDAALDNLTEEDDQGLELGDNFEDSDVMTVAGEPYGGTKWYVDKWADNLYIITSELWGQDGGGPEEGVYEELESIEEVWDYISQLDQLSGVPALGPKNPEPPKPDPKYCFDKRFFKLVEYFRHNLQPNVKLISVNKLTPSVLEFKEHYNNGDLITYTITMFAGEPICWTLNIRKNEQALDQYQGKDWENLLKVLKAFFSVPNKNTPDYSTLLTEYVDAKGNKITNSGHSSGWSLHSTSSPEVCEGCGQVVEFNPNIKNTQMFFEPFQLKNGHKLCSECMEEWIKLPKGFVDKMSIISQYEIMGGDIDEFVENIKLSQKDVDDMIQEWNNKKKQGLITLQPQEIGSIETYFVEAVQKLGLKATKADFV
jgi:hypothetical protein